MSLVAGASVLASSLARGETVRLDAADAVHRALAASHPIAAAQRRSEAARAGLAAADAALGPAVVGSAAVAERSSVPEFAAPLAGPASPPVTIFPDVRTAYTLSVGLTQPLYTGGALTASREAARHELDAATSAHDAARADVALAAATTYWQAVAADAALANAEQQERRALRLETDVANLRSAGMAVEADVLSARARAAAAHLAVVRARAAASDELASLRSLADLPRDVEIVLAEPIDSELPAPPPPLASLVEQARSARPEVAAARARVLALTARERMATAPARPTAAAAVSWDLARPNQRYLPLTDRWHDSWSVGLAGVWTLWDGGRTRAAGAVAGAEQRAAEEDRAELERRIDLEVDAARRALESTLESVAAAEASRAAAVAREAAVSERLAEGLVAVTEELEAQSDLAAAESDRVEARTAARIAAARLGRAVGQ